MKKFFLILLAFFFFGWIFAQASAAELSPKVKEIIEKTREKHAAKLDDATLKKHIPDMFKNIFQTTFPSISRFTAKNTIMLGGKTEKNFVKKTNACTNNTVIVGIDIETGKFICKARNDKILVKVYSGKVSSKINNTTKNHNTGDVIEITNHPARIETSNSQASLQFLADNSIVRLSTKTAIKISPTDSKYGNSGTFAQVALANGALWGRVLWEEMYFGSDVVAGVRGTSIGMIKNNNQNTIEIIDAQRVSQIFTSDGSSPNFSTQQRYNVNTQRAESVSREKQYKNSFFNESTKEDIAYMNNLIASWVEASEKINQEIAITWPTNKAEEEALCGSNNRFWKTAQHKNEVCRNEAIESRILWKIIYKPRNFQDTEGNKTKTESEIHSEKPDSWISVKSIKLPTSLTYKHDSEQSPEDIRIHNYLLLRFSQKISISTKKLKETNNTYVCLNIRSETGPNNTDVKLKDLKVFNDIKDEVIFYNTENCLEKNP